MSYLDNLENQLKSLERQEERDPEKVARERQNKEAARQHALAAAPYANELRTGAFTQALLGHATRIGFKSRVKVQPVWMDTTLRLDARNLRLELRPTPEGVRAHRFKDGVEISNDMVDLAGDAEAFASRWLADL